MNKTIAIAASLTLLTLGACGTTQKEKMMKAEAAGMTATECFTAGGTITTEGVSMCKMKDGSVKPVK